MASLADRSDAWASGASPTKHMSCISQLEDMAPSSICRENHGRPYIAKRDVKEKKVNADHMKTMLV
jgi:hypothetical protein